MGNQIKKVLDRNGKKVWLADLRKFGMGRVYRQSQEAAEAELADAIKKRGGALSPRRREITFAEQAEEFLATVNGELAGKTVRSYRDLLKRYVLPTFGRKRVVDISVPMIKAFLTEKRAGIPTYKVAGHRGRPRDVAVADFDPATMKRLGDTVGEKKLSAHTVRLIRASISVVLASAVEDRLIDRNPVADAKVVAGHGRKARALGKIAVPKERVFAQAQIAALLEWADARDQELRDLIVTSLRLGTRPGETRALKWGDLTEKKIQVERSADDLNEVTLTKTGEKRSVDVSAHLADVLRLRWLKRGEPTGEKYIFGNGEPIESRALARRFELALRECGIVGHSLYDLRHTCGSTLYQRCRDVVYCARQLGHTSETFLRHYAHHLPDAGKNYVDLLDDEDEAQATERDREEMNAPT
jgi:integrase